MKNYKRLEEFGPGFKSEDFKKKKKTAVVKYIKCYRDDHQLDKNVT